MLLRRRHEQQGVLAHIDEQINLTEERILTESSDRLYGPPTDSFQVIGDECPTQIVKTPPNWPNVDVIQRY